MPMEERLELSIDDALARIDQAGQAIEDRFDQAATSFKVALAEALDVLKTVEVTADASGVTTSIDQAVIAADTTPTISADASEVTTGIDQAVGAADVTTAPIVANADDVTQGIDAAIAAADTTITVEADTSQAEDALAGLGDSGTEAGKGLSDAASGATDASSGLGLVGPAAGFAAGEMGNLTGIVGKFGPEAAGAAAGGAALVEVGKDLFEGALQQQTAIERLNRTFGDEAEAVQQIHIGGLNEDLEHLALQTGSNVDGLRNFAASFGQLGIDSGHAKEQVAGTVDQIIALAARASVLNPNLGAADEIVQRLSTSLARGGRFLSLYGIALTGAEIQARALIDTDKQSAAELTVFEKSAAGAEIATERLGTKLGRDITTGAQSDAVQVRRLGVELEEAKKKAGAGLVEPVTESMKALVPVLTDSIQLLGQGLTGALKAVEPELKAVGTAASFLGTSGGSGFGLFGVAVKNLIGQINPLHQVGQLVSLTEGHFSDFAHGLPAIGVAFDVFDKGKSKTEQLAEATKNLAKQQNDQAHVSLITAVNAGELSRADELVAIQQHTAKDGSIDWVGVLDQLQGSIVTTASKSDQYSEAVANQAKATKDAAQGTQDLAQAQLGTLVATGQLTQAQLDHLAALNLTKGGTADYVAILQSIDPAAAKVVADQALIAGGLDTQATRFTLAKDQAALYGEQFDQMVGPFLNAEKAQDDFTDKIDAALSIYGNAAAAAKAYKDTIDEFVEPALAANEANIKLQDTIDKTNKTLDANKGLVDERAKAGRDDEQAVIDLVRAYNVEVEALIASGESSKVVTIERQGEIDKLNDLKRVYPGLGQSIDEYVGHIKQANDSGEDARRVTEAHRKALEDIIESGDKWIQTLIATGTNETSIASARQEEIDKLQVLKAQYPELSGTIDTYIAQLNAIPPSKDTFVNLPNTLQNEVDLSNIHDAIDALKAKGVPITVENVRNALDDAAAVKGGIEAIPRSWPVEINARVNGLNQLQTTESLLRDFIDHPNINVNANIIANIAAGIPPIPRMAGGPVWPGVWTVGEGGPETLFINQGGTGFVVPNTNQAASAATPSTAAGGVSAAELDRLVNAVVTAVQTQRPIILNEVAQNLHATAAAVDARLGARVNF